MEDKTEKKKNLLSFGIKRFIKQCFKSWKLMGSCVLALLAIAAAYLYTRKDSVEVFAQLMLPPESSTSSFMPFLDMAASLSLGDMFGSSSSTENEIAVIQSHTVMERTARDLNLNVTYAQRTLPLKWHNTYDDSQLHLSTLPSIPDTIRATLRFDLTPNSDGTFDILCKKDKTKLVDIENAELPITLETAYGPFTIAKTDFYGKSPATKFRIFFTSYSAAAETYNELVLVYAPNKKTDFIDMSFFTNDPKFGVKLLNKIIDNYNLVGNQYRDDNSTRTLDFVNKRLASLEAELAQAEGKMTSFMKENQITNPEVDITALAGKESVLDSQILSARTELEIIGMTRDFLSNPENNYSLLPAVTGGETEMEAYNELILKRMKLVASAKPNNPALIKLNEQIDAMRENIISSVDRAYSNKKAALASLQKENSSTESRKSTVPALQQEYTSLGRDVYMLQQLYVLLLQQREDAELNMLKTSVSLFTVDAPYAVPKETTLSTKKVLAIAIFLGLCLGAGLVFLLRLPKSPLDTDSQIEELSDLPLLGNVTSEKGEDTGLIADDTAAAESMRMLRSNVRQALDDLGKNVITVTSAINGEGATFIAANLALALAKAGYATTLVEANMRSPRLAELFPKDTASATLAEILSGAAAFTPSAGKDGHPEVICAGKYSGNPADLLGSDAMGRLIKELSAKNDYVVIDATHMQGYSDVFAMADLADITLIVAKTNVTTPKEMKYINGIYAQERLPRMAGVINSLAK